MCIHNYYHRGHIYNRLYKDGNYVSRTDITKTPEKAWYSKDGKVLCAFKESRDKFEKLVEEAREDGRLPKNQLLEVVLSSESDSGDDVEIDIKEGTIADGFY